VMRLRPASRRASALSRVSSAPFVVSAMSSTPRMRDSIATSRSMSRRRSGSPPVRRNLATPSRTNSCARRAISSKVNNSARSRKAKSRPKTSFGMQYVQRKLHRSVTEIRRSRSGRPRASTAIWGGQLDRREQKLQHRRRAFGPGALAVVGAAVFEVAEVAGVPPAALEQPVAQHARIGQPIGPLTPSHIEPDARAVAAVKALDIVKNDAVVPPDGRRHHGQTAEGIGMLKPEVKRGQAAE